MWVVVVAVIIACQWMRVEAVVGVVVGVVVIHQWRKRVCFDMIVQFVRFGCGSCGLRLVDQVSMM